MADRERRIVGEGGADPDRDCITLRTEHMHSDARLFAGEPAGLARGVDDGAVDGER